MRRLKLLWFNILWVFGYRSVFTKEPSQKSLIIYAKMGRAVATKHCKVCRREYWVVGNPKVRGRFSLTCGRRECYLQFNMNKEKYVSTKKKNPKGKSNVVESGYNRPSYKGG